MPCELYLMVPFLTTLYGSTQKPSGQPEEINLRTPVDVGDGGSPEKEFGRLLQWPVGR